MKYIFLFTAGCLLSGLISIPAHAETFPLTIEEAEEEKAEENRKNNFLFSNQENLFCLTDKIKMLML